MTRQFNARQTGKACVQLASDNTWLCAVLYLPHTCPAMHTFLSRVNAVSAFSLSTLAALTFFCFASTFFKSYTAPVTITAANIVLWATWFTCIFHSFLPPFGLPALPRVQFYIFVVFRWLLCTWVVYIHWWVLLNLCLEGFLLCGLPALHMVYFHMFIVFYCKYSRGCCIFIDGYFFIVTLNGFCLMRFTGTQ